MYNKKCISKRSRVYIVDENIPGYSKKEKYRAKRGKGNQRSFREGRGNESKETNFSDLGFDYEDDYEDGVISKELQEAMEASIKAARNENHENAKTVPEDRIWTVARTSPMLAFHMCIHKIKKTVYCYISAMTGEENPYVDDEDENNGGEIRERRAIFILDDEENSWSDLEVPVVDYEAKSGILVEMLRPKPLR